MDETEQLNAKQCTVCKESKPLTSFLRRTGGRSGSGARRGTCRECRMAKKQIVANAIAEQPAIKQTVPVIVRVPEQSPLVSSFSKAFIPDQSNLLRPNREGKIWMRGKTDKGRRWYQEIELDLAIVLVRENAAVLVNRYTIRRLFSNKDFRRFILDRDERICYFCGLYGDTIDHKLPRAKGGHTTPDNCVCACNACNQSKADQDIEAFMGHEG